MSSNVETVADRSPCALDLDIENITASRERLVISFDYLTRQCKACNLFGVLSVISITALNFGIQVYGFDGFISSCLDRLVLPFFMVLI